MGFKMDGFDEIQKKLKDMAKGKNIPAECPLCNKSLKISEGINNCPHCKGTFEVTYD